jgi:protocatechuate 3,4-dioxygenase, alpha subunit
MSVNDPDLIATPSETVGPFFHFGIATDPSLGRVVGGTARGGLIRIGFRITDGDGAPVPDALVEIWQVDADGAHAAPPAPGRTSVFFGFGRLPTADDGKCEFETIRPGHVRDAGGRLQASHINVCLFARGLLRHLHTRLYFPGDPAIEGDPVLAIVPAHRRQTLFARPDPGSPDRWVFEIRLQGEDETVFFDV